MMYPNYPQAVIKKARSLYEKGYTFSKIAKDVGIKRQMTVFDWSKKFGWKRQCDINYTKYPNAVIKKARSLYEKGYTFSKIAKDVGIKRQMTVFEWCKKFGWKRQCDTNYTKYLNAVIKKARSLYEKGYTFFKNR